MFQWIIPTVNNAFVPFQEQIFSQMVERLLKLAVRGLVFCHIEFQDNWYNTFDRFWMVFAVNIFVVKSAL